MTSSAVLAIWVHIDPEDDEAFNHWHSREHVQERVGLPGWLRGSRFKGVERPQRYLLVLRCRDGGGTFDSAAYYARLKDPTPLSRAIFPTFRNPWRTICSVERREGDGIGAAVLMVRGDVGAFEALSAYKPARIDLLRGEAEVGQAQTTERKESAPRRRPSGPSAAIVAFFWSAADAKNGA